ncbi:MAG: F420-nonreducing hydrogenase [Candidatus Heimdallarchaeota archaeon]|nr:F420-nonreducing hydrogenase [Candidatus Heimdallarchaeota archaeon]
MNIGIVSLSSCSGCQVALLDHKELLEQIIDDLTYGTTLFDQREIPELDICFIEGAIRTSEDVEKLQEARQKAKTLISLGSCAVYGGVQALGNLFQTEEVITIVAQQGNNPFTETPTLTNRVVTVDDLVQVDYYIPGCPPSRSVLEQAFNRLFFGKEIEDKMHRLPVCAECNRKIEHFQLKHFKKIASPDPEICLLSQGYICLGSVTRGGCQAQCPSKNVPCSGCRGPTDRVLTRPTHYVLRDFVKRVAHFTGKKKEEVEKEIMAIPWEFYPFTFASQILRQKPHSKILELQAPIIDKED